MSEKPKKKKDTDKEKSKEKSDKPLHSLLIVENTNGNIFFVKNKNKKQSNKNLKKLLKKKRKEEKLLKKLHKAIKLTESLKQVKKEPTEETPPADEEYNPYFYHASQNDIFIVDGQIKQEPEPVEEVLKQDPEKENIESSDPVTDPKPSSSSEQPSSIFDSFNNFDNDEDDDFTWQQDEDDEFLFGLNNSAINKKTETPKAQNSKNVKTSTTTTSSAASKSIKETAALNIKTEIELMIKEEPYELAPINDLPEPPDADDDFEDDDDYEPPKTKKSKKDSKKEPKFKGPKMPSPWEIKKEPEEIEAHKKKKLTGKKACKYCASVFKTQTEMDRHKCEYLKCDPDKFICRICYKQLSRNTFSNHMGYVHGDPRLQCDVCSRQFKDNRKLKYHMSTHTGDRPFKCTLCPLSFISKYGLVRHMGHHGIEPPTIECRFCDKKFANNYSLKQHESQIHTMEFLYYCDYCARGFVRKDLLLQHLQSKHLQIRPFVCNVCGFAFTLKKYLNNHFKIKHSPSIKKKYECHICNRVLSQGRSLRDHLMLHTGERKFVCDSCGETFITRNTLNMHKCMINDTDSDPKKRRRKQDTNKEQYFAKYCRYCAITFDTWAQKDLHQCPYLLNASDPKYYICRYCSKEIVRNSFSSHITVHSEASHECSVCSRMFKSKKTLKQHMWIHTDHKKYKCDQCEKSYSKKEGLLVHMGEHGLPIPIIQCDQCPKTFHALYRLNDHKKRIHEHPELYSKKKIKKEYQVQPMRREVTVIQYQPDLQQQPPPLYY